MFPLQFLCITLCYRENPGLRPPKEPTPFRGCKQWRGSRIFEHLLFVSMFLAWTVLCHFLNMPYESVLIPMCRWGNWRTEKQSDCTTRQSWRGKGWIGTSICLTPSLWRPPPQPCVLGEGCCIAVLISVTPDVKWICSF